MITVIHNLQQPERAKATNTETVSAAEPADAGVRQVLWADGDELVAAVADILSSLGSGVRDMDAERAPGTAKREDIRLTLGGCPG